MWGASEAPRPAHAPRLPARLRADPHAPNPPNPSDGVPSMLHLGANGMPARTRLSGVRFATDRASAAAKKGKRVPSRRALFRG